MRMVTLLFGAKPYPYLAIATTRCLAEKNREKFPKAAQVLKDDFYVEDLCTGDKSDDKVIKLYHDLTQLMALGGFQLAKWSRNSEYVMKEIPDSKIHGRRKLNSKMTKS